MLREDVENKVTYFSIKSIEGDHFANGDYDVCDGRGVAWAVAPVRLHQAQNSEGAKFQKKINN